MNTQDFQDGKKHGKLYLSKTVKSDHFGTRFLSASLCLLMFLHSVIIDPEVKLPGFSLQPLPLQLRDLQRGTGPLCASVFSSMNLSG